VNQKELGSTGVMIPEIGLGTFGLENFETLRRGIELGATLVDTAEMYQNEAQVGRALATIRDDVFIATKVLADNLRHDDVIAAADRSLHKLGTDRIDLYQIHWPNPEIPIEDTMGAMEKLVDAGKVRFIGVSNFSRRQLAEARAALRTHAIVSNQVSYSLVERTIERDLMPYCQTNDITIIAYSPLARGLSALVRDDHHGALEKVSTATGRSVPQVALNWCASRPDVVAIPKANSQKHIVENCAASGWQLSPEHRRQLEHSFRRGGRA